MKILKNFDLFLESLGINYGTTGGTLITPTGLVPVSNEHIAALKNLYSSLGAFSQSVDGVKYLSTTQTMSRLITLSGIMADIFTERVSIDYKNASKIFHSLPSDTDRWIWLAENKQFDITVMLYADDTFGVGGEKNIVFQFDSCLGITAGSALDVIGVKWKVG